MEKYRQAWQWNLYALGILMLAGGLVKLFVMKSAGLAGMLGGLGFPAPQLMAWVLIVAEIGSGVAILAKYKLEQVVWVPIVIVLTAIVMYWKSPLFAGKLPLQLTQTLVHITLASNYWLLGNRR
tara:strand:+ start:22293 stop:22664 length:372 start_codon:yes stop_codon:yes gene_type:complete